MEKKRVVSGARPTGRLHLGNLVGALETWRELQDQYDCFYFVADWHALTTDYSDPGQIQENTLEMVTDWLAVGLDPNRSTLFVQSAVPEHAELHLLLSMITPLAWLERNPTYKEIQQELGEQKDLSTYGFLGYPVLQAADIMIYKANFVPVGQDQLPHVELTREIARRFNHLYRRQVFPVPDPFLSQAPKVPGTDGRKMSKSYQNAIYLSDPPEVIQQKIKTMTTDTARVRRTDPGEPERSPVFSLHEIFSSEEERAYVAQGCRTAGIGCLDCKAILIRNVLQTLAPIQERRAAIAARPAQVKEILIEGGKRAQAIARQTLEEVQETMGIHRDWMVK
ncbi:MAG: tryptophan--tRNA ligase [Candidatus Tectomicrobia bacterium]|uniref:Tryptophan--tRNA ligase n=1 Tax=Tectimicrobiota bacterium TaxID=2528274 RepID=A0A932CNB1_UNCTE|nr:tryptophan--tRNA ligase [Candidatus Tectomicrobia bacterium]